MLLSMPQSLANLLTHLIFSTKNREPLLIGKELRQQTHACYNFVSGSRFSLTRLSAPKPYLHLYQLLYPDRDREVTEELGQTINLAFYPDAAVVRLDDLPGDG